MENENYILWLEHASTSEARGKGAVHKLHECPTQKLCTQLINAARLHQHLRLSLLGGRCLMHLSFIDKQMGMGLVVERDVKPGEALIIVPDTFAHRYASNEGLGKNADWANELDRVERFAVRLLMMWNDPAWKVWKDLVTSHWLGDTPAKFDLPTSWTPEQFEPLCHVNPFVAAAVKSLVTEWTDSFITVQSSLKKIIPDEVVTLEHWICEYACEYAMSRATDDAIIPYVELLNHSPDGETLLVSPLGEYWMRATRHYTKGQQVFFQYFRPPGDW